MRRNRMVPPKIIKGKNVTGMKPSFRRALEQSPIRMDVKPGTGLSFVQRAWKAVMPAKDDSAGALANRAQRFDVSVGKTWATGLVAAARRNAQFVPIRLIDVGSDSTPPAFLAAGTSSNVGNRSGAEKTDGGMILMTQEPSASSIRDVAPILIAMEDAHSTKESHSIKELRRQLTLFIINQLELFLATEPSADAEGITNLDIHEIAGKSQEAWRHTRDAHQWVQQLREPYTTLDPDRQGELRTLVRSVVANFNSRMAVAGKPGQLKLTATYSAASMSSESSPAPGGSIKLSIGVQFGEYSMPEIIRILRHLRGNVASDLYRNWKGTLTRVGRHPTEPRTLREPEWRDLGTDRLLFTSFPAEHRRTRDKDGNTIREIDIANLDFIDLPSRHQDEYLASADDALGIIVQAVEAQAGEKLIVINPKMAEAKLEAARQERHPGTKPEVWQLASTDISERFPIGHARFKTVMQETIMSAMQALGQSGIQMFIGLGREE